MSTFSLRPTKVYFSSNEHLLKNSSNIKLKIQHNLIYSPNTQPPTITPSNMSSVIHFIYTTVVYRHINETYASFNKKQKSMRHAT